MNEELLDKENQYKYLWKEIFNDKEVFIDNYFNNFFSKDNFFYIEKDNNIVSSLLAIPYNYCYNEKILSKENGFSMAYLSGILTKKEYRKQGICQQLIETTLKSLYKKNDTLITSLIAANSNLIEYYKRFGFCSCCNSEQGIFTKKQINKVLVDTYVLEEHHGYYFKGLLPFIKTKDKATSHTKETLELYNNKEYLSFVLGYQYTSRAMAIGIKTKDKFIVLDISYKNIEAKEALLSHLAFKFKRDIIFSCYNPQANKLPFQMIRIINAKKALMIYAEKYPETTTKLHIKDDIIEENNITINISNGIIKEIPNSFSIKDISIEELTKTIFDNSYLFLMLEK